jgi:hypothetical protein
MESTALQKSAVELQATHASLHSTIVPQYFSDIKLHPTNDCQRRILYIALP